MLKYVLEHFLEVSILQILHLLGLSIVTVPCMPCFVCIHVCVCFIIIIDFAPFFLSSFFS